MNLLEKAKVITTPTAYSDGILHSVKPSVVLGNEIADNNTIDNLGNSILTKLSDLTYNATSDGTGGSTIRPRMSFVAVIGRSYQLEIKPYNQSGSINFKFYDGASYLITSNDLSENISLDFVAQGTIPFIAFDGTQAFDVDFTISLKEKLDADFTFTRNSSATRVGEDGYIQDVQIIGGELVQNGDFEEIGSNVIVQGDWINIDSAAEFYDNKIKINAGVNGGTNRIRQIGVIDSGKTYQYTYEVLENNGVTNLKYYNGSTYAAAPNTVGVHTIYYTHTGSNLDFFIRVNDTTLGNYIVLRDNVSVKEVGQNWVFDNAGDWTFEDGKAVYNDANTNKIYQNISLTQNNKYRIQFTISDASTYARMWIGNIGGNIDYLGSGYVQYTNGTYTTDFVMPSNQTTLAFYGNTGGSSFKLDNISLKEVTDDTNLPRINYEGFSYEETLGEQLVTNGDFTTDSNWIKGTGWTISNGVATCDGTNFAILRQANAAPLNTKLQATLEVKNYVSGSLQFKFAPTAYDLTITENGIYTIETNADNSVNGDIQIVSQSFNGSIDNVSVKKVIGDLPIYGSGKGHFLLEGQSTNLVPYSSDFSQWTIQTNSIVTSNDTISPDGTQNASKLSAGTSVARQSIIYDADFSGDFFYSVFAKKGEYNVIQLTDARDGSRYANFDLNNGVIGSYDVCTPSIEDYGNGWYRCVMAFTQVGLLSIRISIAESPTQARLVNFAGNGSDGIYIWGAMLEVDNLSSYIPTNGSAVTRAAETCNNAGNADLFDSEGVLYAEIKPDVDFSTYALIGISDGTTANNVVLGKSINTGKYYTTLKSGGVNQFSYDFAVDDVFNKIAVRYRENDFSVWLNGVKVHTDTSGVEPSGLSELAFDFGDSTLPFYGKTKMVGVFPYLSNDEMECLTGEGYGTFQAMALANNYTVI